MQTRKHLLIPVETACQAVLGRGAGEDKGRLDQGEIIQPLVGDVLLQTVQQNSFGGRSGNLLRRPGFPEQQRKEQSEKQEPGQSEAPAGLSATASLSSFPVSHGVLSY